MTSSNIGNLKIRVVFDDGRPAGARLRVNLMNGSSTTPVAEDYTNDAALIRRTAGLCLKRAPLERRLRLLGVKVASLRRIDAPAAEDPKSRGDLSLF